MKPQFANHRLSFADHLKGHYSQLAPALFCLSGDIARPGLYEIPFGITLRSLIYDLAGGISGGQELQAVLLGGAAGTFATPDQLDIPLTFEDLRGAGLALGSGVVTVLAALLLK